MDMPISKRTGLPMDGYEYEYQVLRPMWEHELKAKNASSTTNNETKERLKEIGIELRTEEDVQNTMIRNPDNFYPELSPDYELMKSTRKSRWG